MNFTRIPKHPSEELLDSLRACKLVGIHGPTGSGKSCLAMELISLIGGTHIEVDKNPGPTDGKTYLGHIDFQILKRKIQNSDRFPIVVDCYVLWDILKIIDIRVDETLLCERVNDEGFHLDPELESTFKSYQMRYNLRASAKQIFTLFISNLDATD